MIIITKTEFQRNIDKYIVIGQRDEIMVTCKGKPIFTIVPEKLKLLKKWESFYNTLPESALTDKDIKRE